MKIKSCALLFLGTFVIGACSGKKLDSGNDETGKHYTMVTLTHAVYGSIKEDITLEATTMYLTYLIHTIGYSANSIRSVLRISSFTI